MGFCIGTEKVMGSREKQRNNREDNLIPFKKGQSGNPKGYPKGKPNLKTLIEKVWNEEITDAKGNKKIQGLLAVKALLEKAQKGDVSAFRELADRMEGKAKDRKEHQHIGSVTLKVIRDDGTTSKHISTSEPTRRIQGQE